MQPNDTKIRASLIGVTGYTGVELLRLLLVHPNVEIAHLTSRQHKNAPIGEVFPHLSHLDLRVNNTPHMEAAKDSDIVFLCLPHKTAQDVVADLHGFVKMIDFSADYRLNDAKTYEEYYKIPHNHPDLLKEVVYGLPEIVGVQAIANASTVANPGCFALLSQLMLFPFKGQIKSAYIFAMTGSSGAGKSPADGTHHPVRNHNIKSYNINKHRHIPEIIRSAGIEKNQLNFVPSSGPFTRGIFAQGFVTLKSAPCLSTVESTYSPAQTTSEAKANANTSSPFVRIMEKNNSVELANVVGSNFCDLSYQVANNDAIIIQGAIDNLVKGAAGAAVQNMNLMFGLEETRGLWELSPVYP